MPKRILKLKARSVVRSTAGIDPERWRSVAGHLLAAARLLWQPVAEGIQRFHSKRDTPRTETETAALEELVRYRGPFFVLAGLAVENQLNTVIVQRKINAGPCTVDDVLKLFPTSPHNLRFLAKRAQVVLSSSESTLFDRLSQFVKWAGRYPIPLNESDALSAPLDIRIWTTSKRSLVALTASWRNSGRTPTQWANVTIARGGHVGVWFATSDGLWSRNWLGGRDSNPDTVVQSHVSYRWTTSQYQPECAGRNFRL